MNKLTVSGINTHMGGACLIAPEKDEVARFQFTEGNFYYRLIDGGAGAGNTDAVLAEDITDKT